MLPQSWLGEMQWELVTFREPSPVIFHTGRVVHWHLQYVKAESQGEESLVQGHSPNAESESEPSSPSF